MEPFLRKVAKRIWSEHHDDIEHVRVVFNNRRAGLFLQNHMKGLSERPFFLPSIMGIDDLVAELGGLTIMPHEFLLFELFRIHQGIENPGRRFDTFEEFFSFGEMMISDFSEIDLYCADAEKLFNYVYQNKRMGEWDVSGEGLTPFQEKYLNFYQSLYTYYTRLREKLQSEHTAYTGMAYRNVAENIESLISSIDCSHVYFVGFNALSDSEAAIIKSFVDHGKGSLVCDGDEYYFSDSRQEAGNFLRKNALRFPDISGFDSCFATSDKKIHIISCPESTLQAKSAGQIIESILNEGADTAKLQDCAIVMADEGLILPVLNSLPGQVDTTNITMGFPFQLTGIYNLTLKILALYSHMRQHRFYHVDLTDVLSDSIVSTCLAMPGTHAFIQRKIYEGRTIYASIGDIDAMLAECSGYSKIRFLFEPSEVTAAQALSSLRGLIALIVSDDIFKDNDKEKESLVCNLQIIDYLEGLIDKYQTLDRIDTLQKIYLRLAQRRSVAFYGKPLKGLQVLGMLETRSLDFKRVIMLSVNEGILPSGRDSYSLIPYALKKRFNLPTFEDKDSVYAYNFYRLMQRTDEVWLLYSTKTDGVGKGEASRFILQIKGEMAVKYPNIKIIEHVVSASTVKYSDNRKSVFDIPKDGRSLQSLLQMAQRGFSPSALNRYRKCPLQFFYSDVLGIREQKEVSEELEANELGTFIHEFLNNVYSRDKGGSLRIETLRESLDNLKALLESSFKEKVLKGRDSEGKNHLYREVARMQLSHFLTSELEQLKNGHDIQIVLTEDSMQQSVVAQCGATDVKVLIEGVTDRVDYYDGQLRIADYKSGSVKGEELIVGDMEPDIHEIPDKWFQVMTYAWLYCRKYGYKGDFASGIFPLRSFNSGFMEAKWHDNSIFSTTDVDAFEKILQTLTGEILNPNVPFRAVPTKNACEHCPLAGNCRI